VEEGEDRGEGGQALEGTAPSGDPAAERDTPRVLEFQVGPAHRADVLQRAFEVVLVRDRAVPEEVVLTQRRDQTDTAAEAVEESAPPGGGGAGVEEGGHPPPAPRREARPLPRPAPRGRACAGGA